MQLLTVTGNLGGDAEKKDVGGKTVYEFSVAARGGKNDETTWYRVACWGDFWKGVAQYLVKGKQVCVVGGLKVRTYKKKDGTDGFSLDVRADNVELLGGGEKADTSFNHGANEKANPFES